MLSLVGGTDPCPPEPPLVGGIGESKEGLTPPLEDLPLLRLEPLIDK